MRRPLLTVLVILFAWLQGLAQTTITVTGKVTDEKGAAIAGATITEKGTRNATTTADDGSFTLRAKLKARLTVSYVGYEPYEVDAREGLRISLNPSSQALSDVVVTGVGVATSKKKVPIDVATVNSKDFAPSATTNVQQQLDGQIAGANIQQTSGTPGAAFLITLRGINDLSNPNPIILVDGVLVTNLNNIDPAIVDRVEVVKGPAGGMLYGAKGANGVIQIFTKKGTLNGKPTITFNSKAGIDHILTGKHDILSKLHHYVTDANGNILDQTGNPIAMDATGEWSDPQVPDPTVNPNLQNNLKFNLPIYDHLKQGYRTAKTFSNSVSVTGGGSIADYAFTASQLNQQDVLSNEFSRSNISVNLGLHPFKGFTFRTITQGVVGYENLLAGDRFNILTAYPFINFGWKDSTGHYPFKTNISSNGYNSLSENQWHNVNDQSLEIFQNFDLNYKFLRFFELDVKYGLEYIHLDQDDYWANQNAALQQDVYWGPSRNGAIVNQFDRHFNQDGLYSAFFRTDFQKDFHSRLPIRTTTQITYEYIRQDEEAYYAEGVGLLPYPPASIGSASIKTSGISFIQTPPIPYNDQTQVTFGALVNQTIEYGNLFGISGGFRSDYGSAFGSAGNAANFPRGTIYFRPSELMTNQQSWLPDWKVRGAYGAAGIQPGPYDRQITLTTTTLGSGVALSLPSTANNNALLLATNYELEVGTDATFSPGSGEWAHKFVLSASYWHRTLKNTYQAAVDAPSTGYASRLDNLANISSHGVDLSLDVSVYNGPNVTWDLSTRWGYYRATVTKIANGQPIVDGSFAIFQGKPLGLFYVQTLLKSVGQLGPDGKTPIIPVANQGNYVVSSTGAVVNTATNMAVYTPANDLSADGHAYPDFTSSLINRVTLFKKFTVSFQFDWTHGNSIYDVTKQWLYTPVGGSGGQGANSVDFDKALTVGTNRGAFVNYYQSLYNLVLPSSPFIENGSFIRLKDVSLTYDFSRYVINSRAIKRLTLTASGRNLLTITKYSGLDPENTGAYDAQGDNISGDRLGAFAGVDYFGTPNLRSYQLSLNVGF
jgi:TonB-dependent starch-binding outer membrane protein SusC